MVVIDGAAGYVPLYRIEAETIAEQHGGRGRGEAAVPGRDENHVTMASEAAGTALERSGVGAGDLGAVFAASITDFYAEHGIAGPVAYRLGATGDVRTGDFQATGRAAGDALAVAREYVRATDEPALVAAADVMPVESGGEEEADVGAGAGAVVLRADADAPAASVEAVGQETTGFVERHREHGEPVQQGDARFERRHGVAPAASAAIDRAMEDGGSEPARAVAAAPGYRLAQTALDGVDAEQVTTFNDVGYAGAATLLLDLAHALESSDDGDALLAVAYGQGGADAVALAAGSGAAPEAGLSVADQIDAKEYVTYAKHLEYRENYDYQGVPST
jgi:3-hydroxy-3-methylglutaryl CoA synthase